MVRNQSGWKMASSLLKRLESLGYTKDDYRNMEQPPYRAETIEDTVKWNEFLRAMKHQNFSVGDSFWLNGVEFEVKRVKRFRIFR